MQMIRIILQAFAIVLLVAVLASYSGGIHALGDSLAVLRPALAGLLIPTAFALYGLWRLGALAVALGALVPILWAMRPIPRLPSPEVSIYQKNLLFRRGNPARLLEDFRASGADVLLLEELSAANLPIPKAMRSSYPYQMICEAHSVGDVAILSRYPLSDPDCREGEGFASARIAHPSGAFTAAVVHLHWPYPFGQRGQVDGLLPVIEALERPVILGGDFNMVPWAGVPRQIARATDTTIARPLFPTLFKDGYPLPIDHMLVPAGARASLERRPKLGSDHYGVLVQIGPIGAD